MLIQHHNSTQMIVKHICLFEITPMDFLPLNKQELPIQQLMATASRAANGLYYMNIDKLEHSTWKERQTRKHRTMRTASSPFLMLNTFVKPSSSLLLFFHKKCFPGLSVHCQIPITLKILQAFYGRRFPDVITPFQNQEGKIQL